MINAGKLDAIESGEKPEKYITKAELARVLVPAPLDGLRTIYRW